MPTGRKSTRCLELEKGTPKYIEDEIVPSPFEDIFKPENIVSRSQIAMSKATTLSEVLKTLNKPKDYEILRALQESDKLIRNLVREGAISEDSIFTQQVLSANSKILRK